MHSQYLFQPKKQAPDMAVQSFCLELFCLVEVK